MKINQFKIFKGSIFIIFFSNLANIASLIYQIFLGKNISPSDYGLMISFYSALGILSLPTVIIPFIVNNFLTKNKTQKEKNYFLANIIYLCGFILLIEIFFIILFKDGVYNILKFNNFSYLALLLVLQCLIFFFSILMGVYTSKSMYFHFSIIGPSTLYFRLILLFLCIYFLPALSIDTIFKINILAVFLSTLIAIHFLKIKLIKIFFEKYEFKNGIIKIIKFTIPSLFIFLAIIFLQNIDAIIVRKILSKNDSGLISSAIVLGKIPLFLFSALVYVIFPEIKKNINKIKNFFSFKKFLFFLFVFFFISASYCSFIYLIGDNIISLIFKKEFKNSNFIFAIISFYYFQVSLFLLLTSSFLADFSKKFFFHYIIIFFIISIFCIFCFLYLKSAEDLFISLNIMAFASNVVALIYAVNFFSNKK
jgi:O-antigen/teichoic acid export membrane protein